MATKSQEAYELQHLRRELDASAKEQAHENRKQAWDKFVAARLKYGDSPQQAKEAADWLIDERDKQFD
jgi:hypothetical protein